MKLESGVCNSSIGLEVCHQHKLIKAGHQLLTFNTYYTFIMSKDFYPDLKVLEENLFTPQKVEEFIGKYGLPLIIENATSATNQKSKNRLRDLFRKISSTPHLGQILLMFNDKQPKNVKLLSSFMASANSQMLFDYFQNYGEELVNLIKKEPRSISLLLGLIEHESGLKVLKTFQKIYKNHQDLQALYSEDAREQLLKGIHHEDTTIAMRYIELVTNIATYSERCFNFIKNGKMLEEALNHYNTTDTLLKLNVVEVMEIFGNSPLTGEFLKKSPIWEKIVAEAFNSNEEFYVRKSLITLVAKMSSINCYEITPADAKNFTIFLKEMFSSKIVDEIDAGIDVVAYLGKTPQGLHVVTHNQEIAQRFVTLSQAPGENTRRKYVSALDSIASRKGPNKPYATIVTLLSCIGDPTLAKSHNLKDSHPILSGLPQFAQWFYTFLNLPFEELKLACIELFRELLEYKQVCVELFGSKHAMEFFKKKLHRYDLINAKKALIEDILKHGDTVWKGHELEVFTNLLRVEMIQGESTEMEYQVQSK